MSLNEENGASSTVFDAGLELIKADFHLHTQKDKEFSYTGEQNDFVKSYIDALKQANIGVGVLTNHNKFDNLMIMLPLSRIGFLMVEKKCKPLFLPQNMQN